MINQEIRYLVLSDIHLGHKNNTTKEIIRNLDIFFDHYQPRSDNLKVIFIAGDLFDTLLDLSGEQIHDIVIWMSRLMKYCVANQIKLRVLEGTPSHDWVQSSLFETVKDIADFQHLDYKYVKTLSIEIMEDFNLSVLYVPDEWHADTEVTLKEVKALLKTHYLTKVDIAIMHGQFTYQLPKAAIKAPKHDETEYLSIVEHFINIGHVHQFSTYARILAQGSFDRLCHGDEIPKGGLYQIIRPDGRDEFFFVENKSAKIFKTINIPAKAFDDIYGYLDNKIEALPAKSFIRLRTKQKDALNAILDDLKKRYADYRLSKDIEEQETISTLMRSDFDMATYTPIVIRPENIQQLLIEQIEQKYPASAYNATLLLQELQGVL